MSENASKEVRLGVIGGSGLYEMEEAQIVAEHLLETPFGEPSDHIVETCIAGRPVFFLPRHGRGHRLLPSEVNSRANIHAFKQLEVTHVLAVSAVGIMQEWIKPGDLIVPDQLFDRTRGNRPSTFFGDGLVGHLPFADPFCLEFSQLVVKAAQESGATVHDGGVYLCMEGPQFSTRAESHFYRRTVGATVIGMTALPEAKLAREAELCYAMLAMGTDYDCWHETEADVEIEAILTILKSNARKANATIGELARKLPAEADCACLRAASSAIITAPEAIPERVRQRLQVLYGHYFAGR